MATCKHTYEDGKTCGRAASKVDPDGFCLFHSSVADRDWTQILDGFQKEVNDRMGLLDFRGWKLPKIVCDHLESTQFTQPADFSNAELEGPVLSNLEFREGAKFAGTKFLGGVTFHGGGASKNPVEFDGAVADGEFELLDFNVNSQLVFKDCTFQKFKLVYGEGKGIGHNAVFSGCRFGDEAFIQLVNRPEILIGPGCTFEKAPSFRGSRLDDLKVKKTTIRGSLDLSTAGNIQCVSLIGCTISGGVKALRRVQGLTIEKSTIGGGLECSRSPFNSPLQLKNSVFKDEVDFSDAVSSNSTRIEACEFQEVEFSRFTSMNSAAFTISGSTFEGALTLSRGSLTGGIEVSGSHFNDGLKLERVQLANEVRFDSLEYTGPFWIQDCDLSGAIFRNMNLSHPSFLNSRGIEKALFDGVTWHQSGNRTSRWERLLSWFRGDGELLEEAEIRRNPKMSARNREQMCLQAGRIYSQLKKNYEDCREFRSAGYFHYGELETARLGKRWRLGRFFLSWDALYWLLSGYGERIYRSVFLLCALLLGFGTAYWAIGICTPMLGTRPSLGFWRAVDAVLFALTVPPLKPFKDYEVISATGHYIRLLNTLLVPIVIAFAVLAVRRRFKR